jgi:hypothetical protein
LTDVSCAQAWWQWVIVSIAWHERDPQGKLLFILLAPLKLVQHLSIPNASEKDWAQPFALAFPIVSPMIVFLAYGCMLCIRKRQEHAQWALARLLKPAIVCRV